MDNSTFWDSVNHIIDDNFTPEGLNLLESYAELFLSGKCLFERYSPQEQYGCNAGGPTNVIASILAGAEAQTDFPDEKLSDFKKELKHGKNQAQIIENWARAIGCWFDDVDEFLFRTFGEKISEGGEAKVYDGGPFLIKSIGLDYYILPCYALDRISLHNAFFPETLLYVIGFGRDKDGAFQMIVRQTFIEGNPMTQEEIDDYVTSLGFTLRNPVNWTFTTPLIYLSDVHDENVIRSPKGNIFIIDCDIRLNTPQLRLGGTRHYSHRVRFLD